jgi:hypothetical protein
MLMPPLIAVKARGYDVAFRVVAAVLMRYYVLAGASQPHRLCKGDSVPCGEYLRAM